MKTSNRASELYSDDPAAKPAPHSPSHSRRSNSHLNSPPSTEESYSRGVIESLFRPVYPGRSLMLTRIKLAFVLSTISVNLFFQVLQTNVLAMAKQLQYQVELLATSVYAISIEGTAKISTALESLEQSNFSQIAETLGLPSSEYTRSQIETVREKQFQLKRSGKALLLLSQILLIAEGILWVFIGYSAVWMLADILLGPWPQLTLILCCVAMASNVITWFWLQKVLGEFIPITF